MGGEPELTGQTLLVIGGSSGIGLETARQARDEGASVILVARDPGRVHRVGLELGASIAAFDATDFDRLGRFFAELVTPLDHILVTGAGPRDGPLSTFDLDDARLEIDAHLLLPLRVAGEAATRVRAGGTVLFTGCTAPRRTDAGRTDVGRIGTSRTLLSALTSALSAMTQTLADELAPVRVNLIASGVVRPNDVAALAVRLMTDTTVTGATIGVEGGDGHGSTWDRSATDPAAT